jgi:glycine/D-amino acid oxidase-like deaminating enzyme
MKVTIIGAGLVGSMISRYLNFKGIETIVIDNSQPLSASKCSAGIWKETWINKSIQPMVDESIPILWNLIGEFEIVEMENSKGEMEKLYYIDKDRILLKEDEITIGKVVTIKNNEVTWLNAKGQEIQTKSDAVVVAAGVWTCGILGSSGYHNNIDTVDSQWGNVFIFNKEHKKPSIKNWAPYRQAVLFNRSNNTHYFGDGCTVKNPLNEDIRVKTAQERLIKHAQEMGCDFNLIRSNFEGLRPYLKKDAKMFAVHDTNLFSAVGTAKNGTILCGYIAKKIHALILNYK